MKDKLITAGVRNLKEFGYPYCTKDNILTDEVYSVFFKSMLETNLGKAGKKVDEVIQELINTIKGK
jgi:hypothetical protein